MLYERQINKWKKRGLRKKIMADNTVKNDEKKTKEKKKHSTVKKVFLIILGAILVLLAVDICITEIDARRIPHHYASAEEGKNLLLAQTDYYDGFTQNDIDYRMKKSGATKEELLKASTDEIRDFNIIEKYLMDRVIAKMARKLSRNGYEFPHLEEITYIKTDMSVEGGHSGYTHGNEIYLNTVNMDIGIIPLMGEYFEHLMWHELSHCLTRNNPEYRAQTYSLINFSIADSDFEMPPCVSDKYFHNPDVEHHDAYATFMIDGKETDCYLLWICPEDYAKANDVAGFNTETVLVPIDGTDTYYTMDQATNIDEVFGTNTNYLTDPEECMADNFADAMQYGLKGPNGQGYPNPKIIEGIIDILSK